jgi:hypothetical protein
MLLLPPLQTQNLYYKVSILLRYDVMPLDIWLLMSWDHNIVSKYVEQTAQLNDLISQENRHVSYTTVKN